MPEKFYLDTDEGSEECKIITSLYSEKRKKHYLIYQPVEKKTEEIYVSIYDPDSDEEDYELIDVVDEDELEEVASLLEEFYDEVNDYEKEDGHSI
ncbi:MAG: DUF1292 domain-containing protein [Bacilli bacterium]|nr:DUF1292 domain-containing protein [Bacilli bacterium]MBR1818341.1 DUF1292 domain-containing protein [Bacilli bacterium]